ncbi:hypothetical protein CPC08DRAFT_705558 [Agrocybe pediades]|nr:hypothetical protein CPC08DRAFT_705558 [Agrocybe pediades]
MTTLKQENHADVPFSPSVLEETTIQCVDDTFQVGLARVADSLSPILESFQDVALLNGFHYFQGDASPEELIQASSIAKSIVQFTLTDFPEKADHRVKTGTIIRLVQLLSSVMQGPLFPNLAHLRINRAESSADQLNMFLSPSMKKLELISIACDRQEELSVFLKILAVVAQGMECLTLRGFTQEGPMLASLQFKQLLHLEINGSAPISFSFLEDVGRLPSLKSFHLHAENPIYTVHSNPASGSHAAGTNLFLQLSKLHIIARHEIVRDLLEVVPIGVLCDISLTFSWPKGESSQTSTASKNSKGAKTSSTANVSGTVESVSGIIESALRKWRETLVSVGINAPENSSYPAVLSPTILSLLMNLNLQQLKISGWGIHSSFDIVDTVLKTKGLNLQALHLPNKQNTLVTLPQLTELAEGFHSLVELRCTLDLGVLSDESKPIYFPKDPLSHPLKALQVGTTLPVSIAQLLPLARFIDYLFPNVEKLDMVSEDDGKLLKALVRLCQDARKDEVLRISFPSGEEAK